MAKKKVQPQPLVISRNVTDEEAYNLAKSRSAHYAKQREKIATTFEYENGVLTCWQASAKKGKTLAALFPDEVKAEKEKSNA